MKTSKKHTESTSELNRQRTARKNTVLVMALLFVALISGGATVMPNEKLSAGDMLWGGLSIIAFASLIWSLYVSYAQSDERQRLIQLKATSLAFIIVIFSIVSAQILHALDIVNLSVSVQFVVIVGILSWVSLTKAVERHSN
jgi:hypothetical protein